MEVIKTVNLTKKYKDVVAVSDLNLSIEKGEIFSLLGINGAGKTTAIKLITGLTAPSSGDAFVNGKSVKECVHEVKAMIGVSPQETAVAPKLSVYENLEFLCGIYGFSKEARRERIKDVVYRLSLEKALGKKAGKLSGGMQRRLSIAMALIGEPEVLFLDEPTLGLDVISRSELWDLIKVLREKTTVILTTHYMEEAESLSDRIAIMKEGKLLCVGTPQEIKTIAGEENFEKAFVSIVKGVGK